MRGENVLSCRLCDYDLCVGCATQDNKEGHALVALIESNDLPGIIAFSRARGGLAGLEQIAPASNPWKNTGPPMFWACWFRHFDALKLLSVLGCRTDTTGASGAWFKGKTLAQYAALLDAKAGHFQHAKETKSALAEAAAANLASIQPDLPLESSLSDRKIIHSRLLDMVEHNSIATLRASLVALPSLVNQVVVAKTYSNGGTLGHWCVWHGHWQMLDMWLELGGDLSVVGSGNGWLKDKDVETYAAFLDSKGHIYHQFADNVSRAKQRQITNIDSKQQEQLCAVCMANPVTHTFLPCGHFCVCQRCGDSIMGGNHRCPICNTDATSLQAIFLAGVAD